MRLIIDIPEQMYLNAKADMLCGAAILVSAVAKGIPVSDNATNERMVGSWVKSRDRYGNNHFTCPFCENDIATKYNGTWDNYCSNCGAKMESDEGV